MLLNNPALYTDLYQLTMAQGYFLSGKHNQNATFDYFFRKCPFKGGYVVFAGLEDFLSLLKTLRFEEKDIQYLRKNGFQASFLNYLKTFRFKGTIHSVREGEIIFPNEPIVRVEGNILEAQLIETLLLNVLNFESLIATKAARIREVAGTKTVLDFGLRRAQGFGSILASKAAIIGGLDGTSNVFAGRRYGLNISGTMAHSWVQSFKNELMAFRTYASYYPDSSVLLVDTYDTLKSGVPNAIVVAKELEKKGSKLKAIRLDSGDLAYLSKKARKLLDTSGLEYVKIAVSNQLDEYLIKSLIEQDASIDIYGVGTRLITSYDDPALDGVYKLSNIDSLPTLKISENIEKITLPGIKKVVRYLNVDGSFNCDGIFLEYEKSAESILHPSFPSKKTTISELESIELLSKIIDEGELVISIPDTQESAEYARKQYSRLGVEYRRFYNPHVYKVGISEGLNDLKNKLLNRERL